MRGLFSSVENAANAFPEPVLKTNPASWKRGCVKTVVFIIVTLLAIAFVTVPLVQQMGRKVTVSESFVATGMSTSKLDAEIAARFPAEPVCPCENTVLRLSVAANESYKLTPLAGLLLHSNVCSEECKGIECVAPHECLEDEICGNILSGIHLLVKTSTIYIKDAMMRLMAEKVFTATYQNQSQLDVTANSIARRFRSRVRTHVAYTINMSLASQQLDSHIFKHPESTPDCVWHPVGPGGFMDGASYDYYDNQHDDDDYYHDFGGYDDYYYLFTQPSRRLTPMPCTNLLMLLSYPRHMAHTGITAEAHQCEKTLGKSNFTNYSEWRSTSGRFEDEAMQGFLKMFVMHIDAQRALSVCKPSMCEWVLERHHTYSEIGMLLAAAVASITGIAPIVVVALSPILKKLVPDSEDVGDVEDVDDGDSEKQTDADSASFLDVGGD